MEKQNSRSSLKKNKTSKLEKPSGPKKRSPLWKWLFLLLLALNLALVLFVWIRIHQPRDSRTLAAATPKTEQVAQVSTTTSQVNSLINSYLEPYQKSNMSYKFYLSEQQAVLNVDYEILGTKIPLYVYFRPLALANGNVSLSVSSISAGSLSLPTSDVMGMLKSYDLPKFVEIKSSSSQIVVHLNKITMGPGLSLKANSIDLPNGKFVFDVMKKSEN